MIKTNRKQAYPILELLLHRWSPRAMSGEPITDDELFTLFEAARWAPSSYNNQPWHFVYAKRGTESWRHFFDLLVPFNQAWTKNAGALILVVSKDDFEKTGKHSRTHSFDTGAAWENLALQGTSMGLVVHGMEGFDYEGAKKVVGIPNGYTVEAMIAVGRPGKKEELPPEMQDREVPSDRKSIKSFIYEGRFSKE